MSRVLLLGLEIISLGFLSLDLSWADQVSTAGNQFSLIPQGARESAMGGDFSALSDGAFGVFGNPAATAGLKGGDLSLSQLFWFTDTNYETAAFAQSIEGLGTLGAGLSLYWVPAFDNTGGVESSFSSTSYEAVVSYSTPLQGWGLDGFSLGTAAHYIADTFGTLSQTSDLGLDLGLYYQTDWKPLQLGLNFQNIDLSPSTINSLPFSCSLGFTLEESPWLLAGEFLDTAGQDIQIQVGGELWVEKFLSLRAGFRTQSTSGSYFGPSVGVGLKLGPTIGFDYAAASYGDLGLVHWIALDLSWGTPQPKPTAQTTPVEVIPTPTPEIIYIIKSSATTAVTPAITPVSKPKIKHHIAPKIEIPGFPLHGTVANGTLVQLYWDPQSSASGPSIGYNVYVSMVQGAGFKKVTDQPITVTHWSEQAGLRGITFYYQVKAVDQHGAESLTSEIRDVLVP